MTLRALIIEDEKLVAWSLSEQLKKMNIETTITEFGRDGVQKIKSDPPDILFVDFRLPDISGIEILREIHPLSSSIIIFFMTAYGTDAVSVEALKLGAYEYLNKPINLEEVSLMVERAIEQQDKIKKMDRIEEEEEKRYQMGNYISQSRAMTPIMETVQKIVGTDTGTILMLGETGTGKDTLARIIHEHSPRKDKPFITVNCASLSEHLLESELFGHEKGAFTDAKSQKTGQVELAHRGTVYLDEIGEIPISFQAKLLRFLETKSFYRVGGTREIKVNVRIIASTNRDLRQEMEDGMFREDLYFRLNVISMTLPPLRERKEDIPLLIEKLTEQFNVELKMRVKGFSKSALDIMCAYDWPGNVRELKNTMERIFLLERPTKVEPWHIPPHIQNAVTGVKAETPDGVFSLDAYLEGKTWSDIEKDVIQWSLNQEQGNQSRAAQRLKISRDQMRYKLKKHGLL
ncbi:MAG: sigma-54-dependent transcriptional regulator [Fidelibacterota bacterium]